MLGFGVLGYLKYSLSRFLHFVNPGWRTTEHGLSRNSPCSGWRKTEHGLLCDILLQYNVNVVMITCCTKMSDLQGIQLGQVNHGDPVENRVKRTKH